MAQKAKKDRAKSNTSTLNQTHLVSLALNAIFLLFSLFRSRSLLAYLLLSLPSFISQYILETTGRPKYDPTTKALKSAGEDLAAQGLTEYMFDIIWVTWACLVFVVVLGNWGWIVWAVVPVYGAWKGYGLLGMARGLMGGAQTGSMPSEEQVQAGSGNRRARRAA